MRLKESEKNKLIESLYINCILVYLLFIIYYILLITFMTIFYCVLNNFLKNIF